MSSSHRFALPKQCASEADAKFLYSVTSCNFHKRDCRLRTSCVLLACRVAPIIPAVLERALGDLQFVSTTPRILVIGAPENAGQLLWQSVRTPESLVAPPSDAGSLESPLKGDYSAALVLGEPLKNLPTLLAFECCQTA